MARQRPQNQQKGSGYRYSLRYADLLVLAPANRIDQLNAAIATHTGNSADVNTFRLNCSSDGSEPATYAVAKITIGDSLSTRSTIQQMAGSNNPQVQSVVAPAGGQADLATLQADYAQNPNIDIRADLPEINTWLLEHGMRKVVSDDIA